ncbi:hypothetical protein AAF129_002790 [Salmonella enterica]|nr:hypothetical protein [Kosakonia cowanii]EBJ6041368.1 hypothetical protein [Salmonella enterica]EBT5441781.1 hypothetical protein [Salmonella enterica]ELG0979586.1 hypothetical protein [Salmonella enterica]TPD65075.1 hypothetical protein FJP70_12450 [Kosakonia cowanii]TPD89261.1 hypothetical protein FJP67_12460 [Kosakonia cowanii]
MDYVDSELNPLTESVKKKFIDLEYHLHNLSGQGEILLLYRGEELHNIKKRLLKKNPNKKENETYERAFYFGDKARHFSVDVFTPGRNYLTNLNDHSEQTFAFIHARICNILKEPKLSTRIEKCTDDRFRQYFLRSGSDVDFLRKSSTCYTEKTKVNVRDYYLYFLHVAGSPGIRKETMLVSTSKDKSIALQFSDRTKKEKVIFHYFVPAPFQDYAIGPWEIEHHAKIIYAMGLPAYLPKGLYPEQNEIAVKGALFPHFLLGIELVRENKFIINSNFTKMNNMNNIRSIAQHGFNIDQTDFEKTIFDTGYIRYGETDGNGAFSSYNV